MPTVRSVLNTRQHGVWSVDNTVRCSFQLSIQFSQSMPNPMPLRVLDVMVSISVML